MDTRKVVAISGSTRKGSTNELILRHIAKQYAHLLEVVIYNDLDKLPHFNPDMEPAPEEVLKLRSLISSADGVLICTPEYIFSLPGSLKNMIDWMVSTTLFSGKPTAFIVASALGEKTFESLNLIIKTLEAKMGDKAALLISGVRGKVSKSGQITDQATLQQIDELVKSFTASM